jgi:hypothetical protein
MLQAFPEQAFLSPPFGSRDIDRASHMSVVTLQLVAFGGQRFCGGGRSEGSWNNPVYPFNNFAMAGCWSLWSFGVFAHST